MTQVFKPKLLEASLGISYYQQPTLVSHKCPKFVVEHYENNGVEKLMKNNKCNYMLVVFGDKYLN